MILSLLISCRLMNETGTSYPDTMKGKDVKKKLISASALGSILISGTVKVPNDVLGPVFAGIKDESFYKKEDVNKCARKLTVFESAAASLICDIPERKELIDWPVPIL
ncbi:MAG TPA: TIGR04452 family lipoprotein [Leptospiraceae bacterium]|nr:TIGR04452 family lipoprotein [Leptospiraceae bacterium]HMY65182.1 TIGR04452 family lipoprotein [Leptospiraceae bacterium]HMZ58093.1 TIGR04452 family lipoprotein [Leptospiraceae bacterium]HNF14672.1 TIGR04452 family lipoprotein [Leptospiraceae bacterium]HNF24777.1 TIGR04452 family lipoprotein [Leptospiraceae bacterium]